MADKEYDKWRGKTDEDTASRFTWKPGDLVVAVPEEKSAKGERSDVSTEESPEERGLPLARAAPHKNCANT